MAAPQSPAPARRHMGNLDLNGNRLFNVGTLIPTPMMGIVIDFADAVDNVQTVTVGLAISFTTANLAPGREKELLITSGLLALGLGFPAAWKWYGPKLALTVAAKEIRLRLKCYGTTDADVRAEFIVQS